MNSYSFLDGQRCWLAVEALISGLAYGAGLCWASVCLLASFRPDELSMPYWSSIRGLRSDTSGILAFFAVAVCLSGSEFLRLRRGKVGIAAPGSAPSGGAVDMDALAVSETIFVLATGLVIYLSVNSVTHPATLDMQATHLSPWPTEGTLRVIALLFCACSVGMLRFLLTRLSNSSNLTAEPSVCSIVYTSPKDIRRTHRGN
jgi:hypothetical protein